MVADHPEQTLRAPPLHFRRRPPQSNYPPDTVLTPDNGRKLGCQNVEGGIPRVTPQRLASLVQSLPPILYTTNRQPMSSCSKGSRGLSVLLRVSRIFTTSAISPGLWLRQRPNRYAFRAGRNLPDKEFRYLRTVIVTAAVYRGFDQELAPHHLTFRHRAGVTPYTSTCVFAECCVFDKQSQRPILCGLQQLFTIRGIPYPEVTVSFCRVPLPEFSQAPWNSLPTHLCRFGVRLS